KIYMAHQILFPGVLYRRFKGEHQHFLPAHFQGQLISGKGLAKTHFSVPQKMRRFASVFLMVVLIISSRFLYRFLLLWSQGEILIARIFNWLSMTDSNNGGFDLIGRTPEPFALGVADTHIPQGTVYIMILKTRTITTHGGLFQHNAIR